MPALYSTRYLRDRAVGYLASLSGFKTPAVVTLTADPTGYSAGTYTCNITISSLKPLTARG